MKTTLITGGKGMVGSQFIKEDNSIYTTSEHDLRKPKIVNHLFDLYKPNYVIHTAAKVGGLGANMSNQAGFFYDNVMMNTNIIEACRKHNVERAAFFLSTCVFPDKVEYPLTEEKIHLGPSHPSNYGYSEAKRAAEVMIRAYNEQYNTKYFCIIPCNIYGPNDNFNLKDGHLIPALIHKCYLAKINNTNFEVWGDGSPLREFIYAQDLADITKRLLYETDFTGNIIVSKTYEHSIKTIATMIAQLMEFDTSKIIFMKDRPNGQFRKPSDNSKLFSVLKDVKFTPLIEGLEKTIKWFNEKYPNVRK